MDSAQQRDQPSQGHEVAEAHQDTKNDDPDSLSPAP